MKKQIYFSSNDESQASFGTEVNSRIRKTSGTFARLTARVWDNQKLSICKNTNVYCSCVCRTLLYGSETWMLSRVREAFVVSLFHGNNRSRKRKCWDTLVLPPCALPSISTGFAGSVIFWGWMKSKFVLYIELVVGKRNRGRPKLRFKEVCKRDLKSLNITTGEWKLLADDLAKWWSTVQKRLSDRENKTLKNRSRQKTTNKMIFLFIQFYVFYCISYIDCLFYLLHHCA